MPAKQPTSKQKPAASPKKRPADQKPESAPAKTQGRASAFLDTQMIYCGDNLEQLAKLPHNCVDLISIDPRGIAACIEKSDRLLKLITVQEILDGDHVQKL